MKKEAKTALLENLKHFTEERITFTELVYAARILPSCKQIPVFLERKAIGLINQFKKGKISFEGLVLELEILDNEGWHWSRNRGFPHHVSGSSHIPGENRNILAERLTKC